MSGGYIQTDESIKDGSWDLCCANSSIIEVAAWGRVEFRKAWI